MADTRVSTVHVEATVGDFAAAQKILCRGVYANPRFWLSLLPGYGVFVVALIFLPPLLEEFLKVPEEISFVVAVLVGFYFLTLSLRPFSRFRYRGYLDPKGSFLAFTDFMVAPDGLHWSSHCGEGRVAWHAILRIVETKAHIFLYVDRAIAHVVPKRSFLSEAAAVEFIATARSYMDAARPAKP